jgi:hypothetical protein
VKYKQAALGIAWAEIQSMDRQIKPSPGGLLAYRSHTCSTDVACSQSLARP